jgi:hypothetical protein
MSIVLGGVTLNPSMQWVDRYETHTVLQNRKLTLAGTPVIRQLALPSSIPITLVATQDTGWITKDMFDAVKALSLAAATSYTFSFFGEAYDVVFRHDEEPCISFTPILYKQQQDGSDRLTGTIKLVTI